MPQTAILTAMLQRLFASMAQGPNINCRPHASRHRIDLTQIARLEDIDAAAVLSNLLGERRQASIAARVPMPPELRVRFGDERIPSAEESATEVDQGNSSPESAAKKRWLQQKSLLTKLRSLSEEARTYEQDTGVHALSIGYPILSLPPGAVSSGGSRVMAPIAFVPVSLVVRTGHKPGFDLACYGQGVDLLTPNAALMAWLERHTGKPACESAIEDEGEKPWEEIAAIVECVRKSLDLQLNHEALRRLSDQSQFMLDPIPRTEDLPDIPMVLRSAVLGLFPMTNESLLRDTQSMIAAPSIPGPAMAFVDLGARLDSPQVQDEKDEDHNDQTVERSPRQFAEERLVAPADPCQSRTVTKARHVGGLVVHGPPGTGKSQTITNIIGDHLARGERVLFVCEKRTALDVVANRLDHLGLGGLCALVHDPQRDQRDLYLAIREQLDQLPEAKTNARADRELARIDEELTRLHKELTSVRSALLDRPDIESESFHELMGQWMALSENAAASSLVTEDLESVALRDLQAAKSDIEIILKRGHSVQYAKNAWVQCVGTTLDSFLQRPSAELRRLLASCLEDSRTADATRNPNIPPFNAHQSLSQQVQVREELRARLQRVLDSVSPDIAAAVATWTADRLRQCGQHVHESAPHREVLQQTASDSELTLIARDMHQTTSAISQQLVSLNEYLATASKWHGFLHVGVRSRARSVLRQYGLALDPSSAERLRRFLLAARARMVLKEVCAQLRSESGQSGASSAAALTTDQELERFVAQHAEVLETLKHVEGNDELAKLVRGALADRNKAVELIDGLQQSADRAAALEQLEKSLQSLNLLSPQWLKWATEQLRAGRKSADTITRLHEQFDTVESVLRISEDLARLPAAFSRSLRALLNENSDPETGFNAVKRAVLAGEIGRRLAADPNLRQLDAERIAHAFDQYRQLEGRKREVVRDAIIHRWRSLQQKRLLVSTGSRLNSEGAKLRQRLFVRGKRAMRLRQVIALGQDEHQAEGDPLFDLCPVWMASPATVAQVFPMQPVFDVVVFDEASQCKLEEALPVLTRAARVVIAGDPKQLPPTRFFEASVTESDSGELETDQDLFEAQQSEIEDLLAAALNLEIEESYLDVHYRSRNSDLIEFSNEQFYGDRLQAIPGHPANRTRFAPITLHRADGVYDKRCNPAEAKRVCEIVRDLLKRAEPPSIGIACFNLTQRDLILEMLDDLALEDAAFAARLAEARDRRGEGSFEGLFVKNLENVQGDERDHIIISTTYGPAPTGKFYRRFGPLGMPGGGRRLNVLVTRARHEIHLVTSIPRECYLAADSIPQGQNPNGGWLLFAYLRYAEQLGEMYETNHRVLSEAQAAAQATMIERPIEPVSQFCLKLGRQLAAHHNVASDVHWGNSGFRVDLALHHPTRAEDVTIGVLCDFATYPRAQDAVEWDIFRTTVHESQGWKLHRLWTPQFFRDQQKELNKLMHSVKECLQQEKRNSTETTI